MKNVPERLKIAGKILVQRIIITLQLFLENGLPNHAAACAYGFLLSIAPMLLLITFFLLVGFSSSPEASAALLGNFAFLENIIDVSWLTGVIFSLSGPGISGVVSVLSILWAGRILAVSMQRGLKIIYPGNKSRNPVKDTLITLILEAVVLVVVLMLIFGSQPALRFFKMLNFFPESSFLYSAITKIEDRIFPVIALGIVSFFVFLYVPVNSPRKFSAFCGALFCALFYGETSMAMGLISTQSMYNFLYGALGNLVIMLVNVYFFFTFFFLGAQLAFSIDSFDALLFSKLRQTRIKAARDGKAPKIFSRLFSRAEGNLKKYLLFFEKGAVIFSQGEPGDSIFYILEGEAEISISSSSISSLSGPPQTDAKNSRLAAAFGPGSFFGEMGYLLSENRAVTARAKTGLSVLELPSSVFEKILEYDTSLDRAIIEHMSNRLKNSNEHIISLTSNK